MSDKTLQFFGRVSDTGEITLSKRLRNDVRKAFSGKEIEVLFRRKKKPRSSPQNAYYWGVVVQLIHEAMLDVGDVVHPQEVHEFLKFRFLRVQKIDHETGELKYEYSRSTTDLSTIEFMEYIEMCIQFAAEYLNTVIPPPGEQAEIQF